MDFDTYSTYVDTTLNATATLISTALVIVVGFNWSETIKQGISEAWPDKNISLFQQKLLLSITLTLLVVILITFIFPLAFPNAVTTQLVKKP